jgi:hypothetical protein
VSATARSFSAAPAASNNHSVVVCLASLQRRVVNSRGLPKHRGPSWASRSSHCECLPGAGARRIGLRRLTLAERVRQKKLAYLGCVCPALWAAGSSGECKVEAEATCPGHGQVISP